MYKSIIDELSHKVPLALTSLSNLRNKPLHDCIINHFSDEKNIFSRNSFLAEPFYEAMFPWTQSANTKEQDSTQNDWNDIVCKLHKYERLYEHQRLAINAVQKGKSIVVTTGTGSGKTECFLYPILNRLAKDAANGKNLNGVQALFLYPLNALIESQGDRLREFVFKFNKAKDINQKIRFANYTGRMKENRSEYKRTVHLDDCEIDEMIENEILWRDDLRQSPPQLLITNATMLEYALVRNADQQLFMNSNLKFIILDEAHTYTGSAAAELAMRLRRVMLAFGKKPEEVQFIATSATVGKATEIQKFLADVAGIPSNYVDVISGNREKKPLGKIQSQRCVADLQQLVNSNASSDDKYQALCDIPCFRSLRSEFLKEGRVPHCHVKEILDEQDDGKVIQYLDWISSVKNSSGTFFLPLKFHVFQKTVNLWACCNPACCGKQKELQQNWVYGKVFFDLPEERVNALQGDARKLISRCDACGSSVYQLLECNQCGEIYLAAQGDALNDKDGPILRVPNNYEEEQVDSDGEDRDDEEEDSSVQQKNNEVLPCLLKKTISQNGWLPQWRQYKVDDSNKVIQTIAGTGDLCFATHEQKIRCTKCNIPLNVPDTLNAFGGFPLRKSLKGFAVGVKRLYNTLAKDVLRHDSAMVVSPDAPQPIFNGKKLLCFTDSRQGTATFAGSHSLKEEMAAIHTWIYKNLFDEKQKQKRVSFVSLNKLVDSVNNDHLISFRNILDPNKSIDEYAFYKNLFHLPDLDVNKERIMYTSASLAKLFVWREFVQRTRNKKSLESLGLARVSYGHEDAGNFVNELSHIDLNVSIENFSSTRMGVFAKILLDYAFRNQAALAAASNGVFGSWDVTSIRKCFGNTLQIKPLEGVFDVNNIPDRPNYAIKIAYYFLAKSDDIQQASTNKQKYKDSLKAYWASICVLLNGTLQALKTLNILWEQPNKKDGLEKGYYINPDKIFVTIPDNVWVCPATNTLLDEVIKGKDNFIYSPYIISVSSPLHQQITTQPINRTNLLELQQAVPQNHNEIWWNNVHEEIRNGYNNADETYCITQESTAQLNALERACDQEKFKAGQINVFNCSTTMEMGVDIGDISLIAMTNVPPHEYNYTQRAGRAGRQGQGQSFIWTLTGAGTQERKIVENPFGWVQKVTLHQALSLKSDVIIQRHVNAFLLTEFIKKVQALNVINFETNLVDFFARKDNRPGYFSNDLRRFVGTNPDDFYFFSDADLCGWNTESKTGSLVADFVNWCNNIDTQTKDKLQQLISQITTQNVAALINAAISDFQATQQTWLDKIIETYTLIRDEFDVNTVYPAKIKNFTSFQHSERHILKRAAGEYGLSYMATHGVLPSNGMPLDVIEMQPMSNSNDMQDAKDIPSRPRNIGIREFAPGTSLIVNGIRKFSSGVILNWKPYNGNGQREPTCLYYFKTCKKCGAFSYTKDNNSQKCLECGAEIDGMARKIIEPSGFVSTDEDRNVDMPIISKPPFELPHISLLKTADGGYKESDYSPNIHIKYGKAQIVYLNGTGWAKNHNGSADLCSEDNRSHSEDDHYHLCLECGFVATEKFVYDRKSPHYFEANRYNKTKDAYTYHGKYGKNLKGARQACSCDSQSHKIVSLGASAQTYAFVITINGLTNEIAANTWALALRNAFVNKLNLDEKEIGWLVRKSENNIFSIALYDTAAGGADLSTKVVTSQNFSLIDLLYEARKILEYCPNKCESICLGCLLNRESQYIAGSLNRHIALNILDDEFFNTLEIPSAYQFWGNRPLTQIVPRKGFLTKIRELLSNQRTQIRFYLPDDVSTWNVPEWRIDPDVRSIYKSDLVHFVISQTLWNEVPNNSCLQGEIIRLLRIAKIKVIKDLPQCKTSPVFMETQSPGGWMQYIAVPMSNVPPITIDGDWGTEQYSYYKGLETVDFCNAAVTIDDYKIQQINNALMKHFPADACFDVDDFGLNLFDHLNIEKPKGQLSDLSIEDKYICNASAIRILAELVRFFNPEKVCVKMKSNDKDSNGSPWVRDYSKYKQKDIVRNILKQVLDINQKDIDVPEDRYEKFHNRKFTLRYADGSTYELFFGSSLTNWEISETHPNAFSPKAQDPRLDPVDEAGKLLVPSGKRSSVLTVRPKCDDYIVLIKVK